MELGETAAEAVQREEADLRARIREYVRAGRDDRDVQRDRHRRQRRTRGP